ncbi:MAG: sugar transferase [Clostridia bacterium]|nr:sugar transferase [Clostridia bacterium]
MQTESVREYYEILNKKRMQLFFKRLFDIVASFLMLILISPIYLILAIIIKLDSKGPVFYRQTRITAYGKEFRIHKFRTMIDKADQKGTLITLNEDSRVTRVGKFIRKIRLDETGQLIDILEGNMSFVGTRPEVPKYVKHYSDEMNATLLLPAGVTSNASIEYKDEDDILKDSKAHEKTYIEKILPEKMKYNLNDIKEFSLFRELKIMIKTVVAVIK